MVFKLRASALYTTCLGIGDTALTYPWQPHSEVIVSTSLKIYHKLDVNSNPEVLIFISSSYIDVIRGFILIQSAFTCCLKIQIFCSDVVVLIFSDNITVWNLVCLRKHKELAYSKQNYG